MNYFYKDKDNQYVKWLCKLWNCVSENGVSGGPHVFFKWWIPYQYLVTLGKGVKESCVKPQVCLDDSATLSSDQGSCETALVKTA